MTEISSPFPAVWELNFLYWESVDAVKTDGFMDDLNSQQFSLEAVMYLQWLSIYFTVLIQRTAVSDPEEMELHLPVSKNVAPIGPKRIPFILTN